MAIVRLRRGEAEAGKFPAVCMRCGQPASTWKNKNFSWCPPWVLIIILAGLLPYIIVALILTKRITMRVPLCPLHQGHWFKRDMFNLGYFLLIVGLVVATFALPNALGLGRQAQDNIIGGMCAANVLALIVWLIANIVIDLQMIKPTEITDRGISLKNVHEGFIEALARWRDEEYGLDDGGRPPSVLPADGTEQIYDPRSRRRQGDNW